MGRRAPFEASCHQKQFHDQQTSSSPSRKLVLPSIDMDTPIVQKKSCCSGKKVDLEIPPKSTEVPPLQDRMIVPIIKEESGCQCCTNGSDEAKPVEECKSQLRVADISCR
jgi:hypothetical protein